MKYQNYVYLDTKANRLLIVQKPLDDKDFLQLMTNNGTSQELSINYCKLFCLGYMIGAKNKMPINNINEFQ